jgi:large subunit ribosomal protein L23
MNRYEVIRRPIRTEKSVGIQTDNLTLCFEVHCESNKTEIKSAVESLFKVKVAEVRTALFDGKATRRGKASGYKPEWKKAYVRLKAGQKLPEYAQV